MSNCYNLCASFVVCLKNICANNDYSHMLYLMITLQIDDYYIQILLINDYLKVLQINDHLQILYFDNNM